MEHARMWHTIGRLSDLMYIASSPLIIKGNPLSNADTIATRLFQVINMQHPDFANILLMCTAFFDGDGAWIRPNESAGFVEVLCRYVTVFQYPNASQCRIYPGSPAVVSFFNGTAWESLQGSTTYDLMVILCNNFVPLRMRSSLLKTLRTHFNQ